MKISEKDTQIIDFIESIGYVRDIEDNVWYTKDYKCRIVPSYFSKHPYGLYYDEGGFNNGKSFRTVEELKNLIGTSLEDKLKSFYEESLSNFRKNLDNIYDLYYAKTYGILPVRSVDYLGHHKILKMIRQ